MNQWNLLSDEIDSILVLHAKLNQGKCHKDRGPAKASHAMDSDAGPRIVPESFIEKVEPSVHNLQKEMS